MTVACVLNRPTANAVVFRVGDDGEAEDKSMSLNYEPASEPLWGDAAEDQGPRVRMLGSVKG